MATTIHMRCGGCDAELEVPIKKTFTSFNGLGYGLGVRRTPTVDDVVDPTGWVWADLVGCTYCPECWKQIESGEVAA